MAKRKRLTPALNASAGAQTAPLEIKGLGGGVMGGGAPIADVAGSAATAAALDELAHELQSARAGGRLVVQVRLDAIDAKYLVRDRAGLDPDEMIALMASLRARGQQTPIEVVDLGNDRFGLISGWRRLTALKALAKEDPDGGFGHIQCLIKSPAGASEAYVAMVEENEIRASLNLYERARIACLASEQGVFESPREAVRALFGSVLRSKRSKIYSFFAVYQALDKVLAFPEAMSERQGLAIAKALGEGADEFVKAVRAAGPFDTADQERVRLDQILIGRKPGKKDKLPKVEANMSIQVVRCGDKITLEGKGLDQAFEDDLKAWLQARP